MARSRRPSPGRRESGHSDLAAPLPRLSEEELYERLPSLENPFLLILDGVEDPHNLGACLRSAAAAGVDAVVAPRHRAAGITDTVRRIASGGAEQVPFVQVTNLARTMKTPLREHGLFLAGTADGGEELIYDLDLARPLAIVMGAEGKGLRRLTAENCDALVRIPMTGSVDCLNVSVAAGVCLFEAVRQRQGASP